MWSYFGDLFHVSYGQRRRAEPAGTSQIERQNSDARERNRRKAKNAGQERRTERAAERIEREEILMGKLDMMQEVANARNAGEEKVMEEMGAEIIQLKKRLKKKASILFRVERDAKERNNRKEMAIKRLEKRVAELCQLNEEANREISRMEWGIKKLEEKVAGLNQQMQGTTTIAKMRRLLHEKTAGLSILEAENRRNVSKVKKVDDLEAMLNRDKKAKPSDLEEGQSRGSAWRGGGTEQSDTTPAELNQRLQQEMTKVSEMEAARRKEEEVRGLEAKVAELSRRVQRETEASRRREQHIKQLETQKAKTERRSDEKMALLEMVVPWNSSKGNMGELEHRLQEEMAKTFTMEETARRKEKETKELEAKVAELRQRLQGDRDASRRREQHIKQLEAQKAETERRLDEKMALLEKVVPWNSSKGKDMGELEHRLQEMTAKLSSTEDDARRWEQKIRDLSATNQKQRDEINQLKALLNTVGEQASNPASQALVSKEDSVSVVEVADLVRMLNAQIEQVSTLIADSFSYRMSPRSGEGSVALNDLRDYLGPWLFSDLRRRSNEPETENDPLIMQIALQTVLVHACSRIINHWNPPFWNDDSIFFRVYSNMGGVGHTIAGTWSALVHTISQSKIREANVKYLSETLVKVIVAAGGSLPSGELLPSEYKEKVEDIAKRALDLHQIVGKDVTSMDLVTYTVPSDAQFDPTQMDDTEGSADKTGFIPQDKVVCTVEMGLQYRKRVELGKQGGEQYGVTLKPKVVLSAVLEA